MVRHYAQGVIIELHQFGYSNEGAKILSLVPHYKKFRSMWVIK